VSTSPDQTVLSDLVNLVLKRADKLKDVADRIEELKNLNATDRTICVLLYTVYRQALQLYLDVHKYLEDVGYYVGKTALSRIEAIESEKGFLDKLLNDSLIDQDRHDTAVNILNDEESAINNAWSNFYSDIESAYSDVINSIDDVLSYIKEKMQSYCTEEW